MLIVRCPPPPPPLVIASHASQSHSSLYALNISYFTSTTVRNVILDLKIFSSNFTILLIVVA